MKPLKNPDALIQARFERHRFLGSLAQGAAQLGRVQRGSLQQVGEFLERSPDAFVGGHGMMATSNRPAQATRRAVTENRSQEQVLHS